MNAPTRQRIDEYVELATDHTGLVALLTLGLTIASPPPGTPIGAVALAGVGVVFLARMRTDALFWGALTVITAYGVFSGDVFALDNHHVLHVYWLAAITVACFAKRPGPVLRRSARLLIGVVFLYATVWKLVSPDFGDATFLTYAASVDANVGRVASAAGLQDTSTLRENQRALAEVRGDPLAEVEPVVLEVSDGVRDVAFPLTTAVLFLEALIAVLFLAPLPERHRRWRDISLIVFLLTTYLALPVYAFAGLLAVMGLTQSSWPSTRARAVYLAVLLVAGCAALAARFVF